MGQILLEDKIGAVSHSTGVITLAASRLSIGGQQYVTSTLTRTISTDVTMIANTLYMIYAVVSGGVVSLKVSANVNSVGPAGFTVWKLVGAFYANGMSPVAFGSFVNLEGAPTTNYFGFIPTVSHTTNATSTGKKRRVGDSEDYLVRTAYGGATDNVGYTVTIANSNSIDTTKINGTEGGLSPFGIAAGHDSGGTHEGVVVYASTTTVQIIGDDGTGGWNGAGGNPFTPGNSDYIETRFSVPIVGWSNTPIKDL